jgi:hypothetical protein
MWSVVLSLQQKFILTGILLVVASCCTAITADASVRAVQSFQQQNTLTHSGDIRTVRPWMTIPYIAHTYHVPEGYLYNTLHITDKRSAQHTTIQALAIRSRRTPDDLIHQIQKAIQTYRKKGHSIHTNPQKSRVTRRDAH